MVNAPGFGGESSGCMCWLAEEAMMGTGEVEGRINFCDNLLPQLRS